MSGHMRFVGHDLPPFWDGEPVQWTAWDEPAAMFICPPPPVEDTACDQCGIVDPGQEQTLCFGLITPGKDEHTREVRTLPSGNTYIRNTTTKSFPVRVLVAYRCTACGHDRVWDRRTDDWWDLDASDYEDTGSTADTLF